MWSQSRSDSPGRSNSRIWDITFICTRWEINSSSSVAAHEHEFWAGHAGRRRTRPAPVCWRPSSSPRRQSFILERQSRSFSPVCQRTATPRGGGRQLGCHKHIIQEWTGVWQHETVVSGQPDPGRGTWHPTIIRLVRGWKNLWFVSLFKKDILWNEFKW